MNAIGGMSCDVRCNDELAEWTRRAIALIEAEGRRSADTHLFALPLPAYPHIDVYLKDESAHPTGSLKHRLARSLFLYGLVSGRIGPKTTLVEASSGSTAVSEAYYARLLGLKFCAVLPRKTSALKIAAIERQGGECYFVDDPSSVYAVAAERAEQLGGYYLDQFTFAERATDWRGNNNIAESIFGQMQLERYKVPRWIVMAAGTGGTSATLGRYIRYKSHPTQLLVPDVEHSAFFSGWRDRDRKAQCARGSRIEGIGRPRIEPSFLFEVVDAMIRVPDAASVAGMRVVSELLGRRVGGSTGTNFIGVCWAISRMLQAGESGAIVSLICDSGERYACTYYDDNWLAEQDINPQGHEALLSRALGGDLSEPSLMTEMLGG